MSRRWVALLAVAVAAGLAVAGCGVPTETDVQVDGPPREAGPPGFDENAPPPPGADDADSAEELVGFFLRAAATDPENAVEVLRPFLHSDERDAWQPQDEQVYVARVQDEENWVVTQGDPVEFKVDVRRVGQLNPDGSVEPLTPVEEVTIELAVTTERVPADGEVGSSRDRYRIRGAPDWVLLDDLALERHFQSWPIYFWDSDHENLVPDLRWLPNSVPDAERSQNVLEWLIDGPSWLSAAVSSLPEGLEQEGNVVLGEGSLEVRLTAPDDEVNRHDLDAQLWWTLRPDLLDDTDVTVVLNGVESSLDGGYRASNPVPSESPASFAVLDGTIVPYTPADSEVFPELDQDLNRDIRRAAVTRDGRAAALVREDSEGAGTLRLTVADPSGATETELVAQDMDRPVWLNNPSGVGLVAADGSLYQFTSGDADVARVESLDLAGDITAVAAAPDGRRLALVVGGRLYVASMVRSTGDVVRIGRAVWLPTTATNLDGVAFVREDRLAVMGTYGSQRALFELTVDGALERVLPGADRLGTPTVTSVVAYPADPADVDADGRNSIMYEANGQTWRYASAREPVEVEAADLLDEEPESSDGDAAPRAPFYLD